MNTVGVTVRQKNWKKIKVGKQANEKKNYSEYTTIWRDVSAISFWYCGNNLLEWYTDWYKEHCKAVV